MLDLHHLLQQKEERETQGCKDATIVKVKSLKINSTKQIKQNELLRSTLETEGAALINSLREKQSAVADIEMQLKSNELGANKEKLEIELDKARQSLDSLKQDVITKRNNNSVFEEQLERKRTEFAVDMSKSMSDLAINTEKLDQLKASKDIDLATKEAQLKILDAERKEIEQTLSQQQKLLTAFSTSEQVDKNDPIYKDLAGMDFGDAFQGDLPGLFF